MVQQINRSELIALRVGQATSELDRVIATPYETPIGFDLETTGTNPREDKLVMVQLKPRNKRPLLIDARRENPEKLAAALIPLMADPKRKFIGQNLLFELHWMLSYLGMEVDQLRARFNDTMIRELVILGLGQGDAKKRGLAVNMHDIGERYGLPVHKEEQSWFINLDKPRKFYSDESYSYLIERGGREVEVYWHADHTPYEEGEELPVEVIRESDEQWYQPFPQKVLEYGRQDVSVVHLIADKQQELIEEYGLEEVVDIETRILPAVAGMQHYGMAVNKDKWLSIMDGIDQQAEEFAAQLHKEIDIPVLEYRRQEWLAKSQPYQDWVKQRDGALERLKEMWEGDTSPVRMKWGEYKKMRIAAWQDEHPKPKSVPALKDGVNLNSPAQILVAFQSRGHQIESAAEENLTPLAAKDPVVQLYLTYKDFQTARTKYGPPFLEKHAAGGIIYPSIQQIGAETGRFAFREPNVQQVPARGAGEHLRESIVPRPGFVFIDADFTNVELMITAWITKDPVMMQAFRDGADLHARTAEVMFDLKNNPDYLAALEAGVTPKKWTDGHDAVVAGKTLNATSYRSIAKTINFGLLYGMGAGRLAATLRIDVNAAKQLMRLYRETYSVAVGWLRQQGQRIERPDQDGRVFAATLAGRRRWFEVPVLQISKNTTASEAQGLLDDHKRQLAGIQRQLGNHPIQGSSADITKLAIALWQERYNGPEMRMVCTIHDEILLEVLDDADIIDKANKHLGEVMHEALVHFLPGMEAKVPVGLVADYWKH